MNRLQAVRVGDILIDLAGAGGVALVGWGVQRLYGDWWMIVVGSLLIVAWAASAIHSAWRRHGGHPR